MADRDEAAESTDAVIGSAAADDEPSEDPSADDGSTDEAVGDGESTDGPSAERSTDEVAAESGSTGETAPDEDATDEAAVDDASSGDVEAETASAGADAAATDAAGDERAADAESAEEVAARRSARRLAHAQRAMGTLTILGVWIFWSPVLFTGYSWEIYSNVFLGIAIVIAGAVAVVKRGENALGAVGLPALAAVLALVTIGWTFAYGYGTSNLVWSNVIAGGLIVLLALVAFLGYTRTEGGEPTNVHPAAG